MIHVKTAILLLWTLLQPDKVNQPPFTLDDGITLFWGTIRDFLKGTAERLPYILVGIFVFFFFWVISKLLRKGIIIWRDVRILLTTCWPV